MTSGNDTQDLEWKSISALYKTVIEDRADPRTADWLFVSSPLYPIVAATCYVTICRNARNIARPLPVYNLRPFLLIYNFLMVLLACYMTYEFVVTAYLSSYNLLCQPVDYSNSALALRMASVCWVYYFSKYIELIETIVFILRKKFKQISFLHVYHHTSMLFVWWLGTKYVAGGQTFLFGAINSFVHAVMYTYYGLSAIGPHMQKHLWWKRYITVLQLSQFVILFFYCIRSIMSECDYAIWLCKLMIGYAVTLLVLFLNFYIKAYMVKNGSRKCAVNGHVIANGKSKHQ